MVCALHSPRRIDASLARSIVGALPPDVLSVAVFRDERTDRIVEMVRSTGARAAQVHGTDPSELHELRQAVPFLIEAISVGQGADEEPVGGLGEAGRC